MTTANELECKRKDRKMFNEQRFDVIKVGLQKMYSDEFIRDAHVDINRFMDMWRVSVTGRKFGQSMLQSYEIKYPLDWWQAVKERFAPRWFLLRYPVIYEHRVISIDAIYPDLHKKLHLKDEPHFFTAYQSDEWKGKSE